MVPHQPYRPCPDCSRFWLFIYYFMLFTLSSTGIAAQLRSAASQTQRTYNDLKETRQCLLQALPHFDETCAEWKGATAGLGGKPVPNPCVLVPHSPDDTMKLLNGTVVLFLGDSTARRANLQLEAHLSRQSFADAAGPIYHSTMFKRFVDLDTRASTLIMSYWYPLVKSLHEALQSDKRWALSHLDEARLPHDDWLGKRKLFVLHYSTWDIRRVMGAHANEGYHDLLSRLSSLIALLKSQPDVDMSRDVILLRLPIAQGCEFAMNKTKLQCDWSTNQDPINAQVKNLASQMHDTIVAEHPDVGLIDVFSWTKAWEGVGRHKCAPTDGKGTHFGSDESRMAYVQQVLFGAQLYGRGMRGWPS